MFLLFTRLRLHDFFPTGNTEWCDDCGNFGHCIADKCGGDGTKEGNKECWLIDGRTGQEISSSRHTVDCSEPCVKKCKKVCDDCEAVGECEECGVQSVKKGTKECWMVDEETGQEVPSTRESEPCEESCFVPCMYMI